MEKAKTAFIEMELQLKIANDRFTAVKNRMHASETEIKEIKEVLEQRELELEEAMNIRKNSFKMNTNHMQWKKAINDTLATHVSGVDGIKILRNSINILRMRMNELIGKEPYVRKELTNAREVMDRASKDVRLALIEMEHIAKEEAKRMAGGRRSRRNRKHRKRTHRK
jgi:hypothetical protein